MQKGGLMANDKHESVSINALKVTIIKDLYTLPELFTLRQTSKELKQKVDRYLKITLKTPSGTERVWDYFVNHLQFRTDKLASFVSAL